MESELEFKSIVTMVLLIFDELSNISEYEEFELEFKSIVTVIFSELSMLIGVIGGSRKFETLFIGESPFKKLHLIFAKTMSVVLLIFHIYSSKFFKEKQEC